MTADAITSRGLRTRHPASWLAAWSVRRPKLTLGIAFGLLLISILLMGRLRIASSLQDMLGDSSRAAATMHRVNEAYQSSDALLIRIQAAAGSQGGGVPSDSRAWQTRLVGHANTLAAAIEQDPEARELIASVRVAPDPAIPRFVREVLLPNGALYLDADGLANLVRRLQPERMAEQFARNETMMSAPGPAGSTLSHSVLKDPLRLFELIPTAMRSTGDASARLALGSEDAEFSMDGRAVLARVATLFPVSDLERSARLVRLVERAAASIDSKGLEVALGGPAAISTTSSQTIRRDAIVSTLLSIAALYALFVLFSRRWIAPWLIVGVAGAGMLIGFGVHALFRPEISPLAAAVGALLAGLGVDYAIHFLAHYETERAAGLDSQSACIETSRTMALPIVTNCFTSIFGFASLWPSEIRMLSEFASVGAAGLLGALVAVFTIMPAVLTLADRRSHATHAAPRFGSLADVVAANPRRWIAVSVVALCVCAALASSRGLVPKLETDLTQLHPQPNRALENTSAIIEQFAGQGEFIPVEVVASQPHELISRAHQAARALSGQACQAVGVTGVLGIHQLLPDPLQAAEAASVLRTINVDRVLTDFDAALAASAFTPTAYADYRKALAGFLTPQETPSLTTLRGYPTLAAKIFPHADVQAQAMPTSTLLLVRLDHALHDRAARGIAVTELTRAIEPIKGVSLAGLAAVSEELELATRSDLPRSILISAVLVLAWLMIAFRSIKDVLLALTPLAFAMAATTSLIVLANLKLNPVNCVAIPLLDGIAVDAGVFLVAAARAHGASRESLRAAFRPTTSAVLLAIATTITGFAALCTASTPAVRSLGWIAAFGISASMVGAIFVLLPILVLRARADKPGHHS